MPVTTALMVKTLQLEEVCLNLDIGGLAYREEFIIYLLTTYDIMLGKDSIEEIPYHINLKKNQEQLDSNGNENCFKYTITGLKQNEERKSQLLPATSKREPVQPQENSYKVGELCTMALGAEILDDVVIGETIEEATFKTDCTAIWMQCLTAEWIAEDDGVA
jgi:hypothetical protein